MNDLDKPTAAQNMFFQAPEIRFHVAAQKAVETFSTPLETWFLFHDGSAFRFAKDEPDDVAVWEERFIVAATKAVLAYEAVLSTVNRIKAACTTPGAKYEGFIRIDDISDAIELPPYDDTEIHTYDGLRRNFDRQEEELRLAGIEITELRRRLDILMSDKKPFKDWSPNWVHEEWKKKYEVVQAEYEFLKSRDEVQLELITDLNLENAALKRLAERLRIGVVYGISDKDGPTEEDLLAPGVGA